MKTAIFDTAELDAARRFVEIWSGVPGIKLEYIVRRLDGYRETFDNMREAMDYLNSKFCRKFTVHVLTQGPDGLYYVLDYRTVYSE